MIFNSLGSNYSFRFALNSLFSIGKDGDSDKLRNYLEKRYSGKATLLYKGREAIKLALKILNLPQNSGVGISGFTCYAVYQAIKESGLKPVYLDIDESLNFPSNKIGEMKALIVQNTLGNPCDMENIFKTCEERNIVLIEDLAHSVGTIYRNNKEAGCVGDFTTLSFSQDKALDAVSGGALIVRNPKYSKSVIGELKKPSLRQLLKDRFYPVFTFKIRSLYPFGLGKPYHLLLKSLNLLSRPIETDGDISIQCMPDWHAKIANASFNKNREVIQHRKEIASIYANRIEQRILSKNYIENIDRSSCLRFPIFVEERQSIVNYLKHRGIFVSDIWYDAPVAPNRLLSKTDYKNECQFSEEISRKIVNLPTHIYVSAKDAINISEIINKWLNTK